MNIIYFNTKYKSYHNSLNYPDGIVQLTIPIFANVSIYLFNFFITQFHTSTSIFFLCFLSINISFQGLIDNPQFNNFEKAFDQVKSDLGKTTCILNKDLVNWFKAEPTGQTYAYYKSSYFDEDTWKNYPCATTVNLPMLPFQHYISCRQVVILKSFFLNIAYVGTWYTYTITNNWFQFINTFGSLINTSGKPLQNPPPFTIPTSLVGFGWEIKLLEIAGWTILKNSLKIEEILKERVHDVLNIMWSTSVHRYL